MNRIILLVILISGIFTANAQREFPYQDGDTTYIMKRYVFMLLESGETKSANEEEAGKFQKLHNEHINKLAEEGKIIVAGPFEGGGNHRGLLIFDVESVEEALKLEGEDPMVQTDRLRMNAFFWWGAKGTVIN